MKKRSSVSPDRLGRGFSKYGYGFLHGYKNGDGVGCSYGPFGGGDPDFSDGGSGNSVYPSFSTPECVITYLASIDLIRSPDRVE